MTEALTENPAPEVQDEAGLVDRLSRSNILLFLAWFILILILKWPVLNQPPIWDTSMSVFPAAITLSENSFDLEYLLDQPGYAEGGPNVHSISLVTWLTAAVIALLGNTSALFPILHLIHFAIAAAAMTALFRFSQPLLGSALGATASLAILLFPLVLTQAGYMYLEFPMLAATTLALLAWSRHRLPQAVLWSVVAVLIKGSGMIVPAAIAAMALFDPRPAHRNWRFALLILAVPAGILAVAIWLTPGFANADVQGHLTVMAYYLKGIPDVAILLLAYLVGTLRAPAWRTTEPASESQLSAKDLKQTTALEIAFLATAFLAFYLLLPIVGIAVPVLPRYYVQLVPFALFGLLASLRQALSGKAVAGLLFLLILWSVINRNGAWYPDNSTNNFALIERSGAYTELLDLQLQEIQALNDLPEQTPIFYDQPAAYKLAYPLMRYSNGPIPSGHSIRHEAPYLKGQIQDFPPEFYMLYDVSWLGGEIIADVWRQAESDPTRTVEIVELQSGQFSSGLIKVGTVGD